MAKTQEGVCLTNQKSTFFEKKSIMNHTLEEQINMSKFLYPKISNATTIPDTILQAQSLRAMNV